MPYVHPADLPPIEAFNRRVEEKNRIQLNVFPEPYLGDPGAPILLLNLNPGYGGGSFAAHAHPLIADMCTRNLRHEARADQFPFYPIHPDYLANAKSRWWEKALSFWITEYGRERVARAFCCVEYFPYASHRFKRMPSLLPSQRYSFELARGLVGEGALVVAMRHARQWRKILGASGEEWTRPKNPQQKSLSPPGPSRRGNIRAEDAERIAAAIESI